MRILKLFLSLALFTAPTFAQGLNIWGETMWTNSTLHARTDNNNIWGLGANFSFMPTQNFAIGPTASLLISNHRGRDAGIILDRETIVVLPLAITMTIDPVPQFRIHPIAHFSFGYNSVWIRNRSEGGSSSTNTEETVSIRERDGYYNGFFVRFGTDAMFDINAQFSVFGGPQWQISEVVRRGGGNRYYRNFNMRGFRFGVSILL